MASLARIPTMPKQEPSPVTAESISRALTAMRLERIAAGLCPLCEPARVLCEITGACTNPYCILADFAMSLPGRES